MGEGIDFRMPHGRGSPDYQIPCGKCDGCAADRSLQWAVRMAHEAQMHDRNCFVTLTYQEAPEAINKKDVQDFIKRLRHHSDREIRYFACGEYGEKTRRPHYHAILFGEDFLGGAYDIDDRLYGNRILDEIWGKGITSIGEFTMASACYVAGYVNKKLNDPDTFSLMSKKPPIGRRWLDKNWEELSRSGRTVINGQVLPVPKVYFDWKEEELADQKERRMEHVRAHWCHELKNKEINYGAKKRLKDHKL